MLLARHSFRLIAAVLALLMGASGSLPFVQHARAMANHRGHDRPCAHGMHGEMGAHHEMASGMMHHDAVRLHHQAMHDPQESDESEAHDCCMIGGAALPAAPKGNTPPKPTLEPTVVFLLDTAMPRPIEGAAPSAWRFFTGLSPGSPVSLHLLYESFRN